MRQLLFLCLLSCVCIAQEMKMLSFLTGCWQMSAGPMVIEEEWGKPAGDGMLGFSRTMKNGKTVFSEFMRIEKQGALVSYTPRIGTKQGVVVFKMTKLTEDEVIFENPTHDFPQRILYRKVIDGLAARIYGKVNGKDRAEEFPYRRVVCDAK